MKGREKGKAGAENTRSYPIRNCDECPSCLHLTEGKKHCKKQKGRDRTGKPVYREIKSRTIPTWCGLKKYFDLMELISIPKSYR